MDFSGLMQLALVACVDEPLNVLLESGPPEAVKESAPCGVKPFVAEVVVGVMNEMKSLRRENIKLVPPVVLPSPESPIEDKEACCLSKESSRGLVI